MSAKGGPGLLTLAWVLLRVGAGAFGGLGSTLSMLQRHLVDQRHWLKESDISEALAITQALPGSTGIQVVAYLGSRLRGWPGAIVAVAAYIAPATTLMVVAAAATLALPDRPWVNGALAGVQVGVVGLLAASMWRLSRSAAKGRVLKAVLLSGCVLGFLVPALVVVVGAGLVGALVAAERSDG
jgi:chromate transporter